MYEWTSWLDHVTDPSNVFTVVDNGNGTWTITPAGTVMQQGTPQDQTHFNNIEGGILDAHMMAALLLNFARQTGWDVDDLKEHIGKKNTVYLGTVNLTNTALWPWNNSKATVSLGTTLSSPYYSVEAKVTAAVGNVGEIEVTDKLANGFKVGYTGSAESATISWIAIQESV